MTPDHLEPDLLQRAASFDVAAKIAHENSDYVFAQTLSNHAHYLRMAHARGERTTTTTTQSKESTQ